MSEDVTVVALNNAAPALVSHVAGMLNGSQREFKFKVAAPSKVPSAPDLDGSYSWNLLETHLGTEKKRLHAKYLIGVLVEPIENNWFSKAQHAQGTAFVSTADWEYLCGLPLTSYIAYQIVENFLETLLFRSDAAVERFYAEIVHTDEMRGCISDMSANKPDISFKIRTGDICPDCTDVLRQRLTPQQVTAVICMLEEIRKLALGRRTLPEAHAPSLPEQVDKEFPFPIAYCFRSMQSELSYSRKRLKLLELYEVTIKYLTFVLLAASDQENRAKGPSILAEHLAGLKRPSLGHWNVACFALLKDLQAAPAGGFLSAFQRHLTKQMIATASEASNRIVPLRNDHKGHGFVEEEECYRSLYEKNLGAIQTLLELVAPLALHNVIVQPAGQIERRQGMMRFSAKVMVGSHPLFPVHRHETREEFDTDCLLHNPKTGKYLSLYPWIVLHHCGECFREMVFLYDRVDDNDVVLREYPTNHAWTRTGLAGEVLNRLKTGTPIGS